MRIRSIKPGFFKHELIADLPPLTRLLFISLWCMADRRGRLEDRPRRIKVECLPFDDCDVDAMLWDLQGAGFIERYEAENIEIIQISAFEKHQRITGKEAMAESEFPEYYQGSNREAPGKQPGSQEGKGLLGKEGKGKDRPIGLVQPTPKFTEDQVQAIYQAYPKHEAKQDALKAIRTALAKVAPETLLEAVTAYALATAQWAESDREYIPLPASWIRAGRWEDDRKNWIRGFPTHKPPAVPGIAHQPPEWAQSKIAGLKLELPEAERQVRIAKAQPFNYDLEAAERALTKIKAEILKLGGTV